MEQTNSNRIITCILTVVCLLGCMELANAGHDGNGGFTLSESQCFETVERSIKEFAWVIENAKDEGVDYVLGKDVDYNKLLQASKNIKVSPTTVRTRVSPQGYEDYLRLDYFTDANGPGVEILSTWFLTDSCLKSVAESKDTTSALPRLIFHEALHHVGYSEAEARVLRRKYDLLKSVAKAKSSSVIPDGYNEFLVTENDVSEAKKMFKAWYEEGRTFPVSILLVNTLKLNAEISTVIEIDFSKPAPSAVGMLRQFPVEKQVAKGASANYPSGTISYDQALRVISDGCADLGIDTYSDTYFSKSSKKGQFYQECRTSFSFSAGWGYRLVDTIPVRFNAKLSYDSLKTNFLNQEVKSESAKIEMSDLTYEMLIKR